MLQEDVVQPLLVTSSAINLACECVRMILKIGVSVASAHLCEMQSTLGRHGSLQLDTATSWLSVVHSLPAMKGVCLLSLCRCATCWKAERPGRGFD